jgi:type IV pilus assembly protein PilW
MSDSFMHSIRHTPFSQRGLTLIEMAIAMTIALFLLAGVMTIVSGTRTTSITQNRMAQLQDNERLAMTLMTDVIEAAGYYPDPRVYGLTDFPAAGATLAAGQFITGTSGSPDTITVRYETIPNDGVINCLGASNTGATAVVYTNTFSLDGQGNLQCQVNGVNGGAAVPLVSGVQNLTILYGVTTAPPTPTLTCTDSYMTAAEVQAKGYWGSVCSVRVTLVFTNTINPATGPISFSRVIAVMRSAGSNS